MPLVVRLEGANGRVLAEAPLDIEGEAWERYAARLTASAADDNARLVLLAGERGGLALDMISLFPTHTFRDRPNGLRADLAEVIAELKPKFIRFPGGCLVHGNGPVNMYRWPDTIGPVEQRKGQPNLWGYHQSVGLGFFEYFQFAEDVGAKPLPVVPAGVCCQNAGHTGGRGQAGIPLDEMPEYIQEVLDLVEYANGPVTSEWGAKRAAAGHPAPFNLQYLGVGNEDKITPLFKNRFKMIQEAVTARYPEIVVVGTVGPSPDPEDADYREGWAFARELDLDMVDEHGYKPPEWYWDHLDRFDAYERNGPEVYLGEYAAHDVGRQTTLRSALSEAAYMTHLERNGDLVRFSSYAPLLGKRGLTQWTPDLIYFTNTEVFPTINYHVQKLFSTNSGDRLLPADLINRPPDALLAVSSVRETASGDVVIKLVNGDAVARPLVASLAGLAAGAQKARRTVLTGDPMAVNDPEAPDTVLPQTDVITVGSAFETVLPPHSLTILRIPENDSTL